MLLKDVVNQLQADHLKATNTNNRPELERILLSYKQVLGAAPDDLAILFAVGTIELQLGFNGPAISYFKRCLDQTNDPAIWNNLGSAYKGENLDDMARQCWEEALKLREDADYYNNMVTLYINVGKPEEGIEWAEKGLALAPDHPRMRWNYSLLLLEMGRWKEGFENYESGKASLDRPIRAYTHDPDALPWWNGEPGKVVVYGEQGMGDEIMFASAIPDAMERASIVFDCHPRMEKLWKRTFGIKCYPTRKSNTVNWAANHKFDYRCAIGDLFRIFRSDGQFPKQPYLKPDKKLVRKYRKRLEALGPGPYVGVSWQAGTKGTRSDFRSIKLGHIQELWEIGGTFVSLQYTAGAGDKAGRFTQNTGHALHHWPEVVEANTGDTDKDGNTIRALGFDFDHTVALIEALDLCILPNTTAVHVCGALGTECWTITPKEAAWRYQLEGDEMPTYGPWVRQFRGEGAIERVIQEYRDRWARSEPAREASG
jgi:tetratricopeptide (TPR) repeat protein